MKGWWNIAFGVVVGLLAGGVVFLATRPARGEPVLLIATPTPAPYLVHVTGAVLNPGAYEFMPGSRIRDALAAAGASSQADVQALNLAAFLEDGQRLTVPAIAPTLKPGQPAATAPAAPLVEQPAQASLLININTASQAELELLPGIGPVMAARVIEYRDENGGFEKIEDLLDVSGIGPATFERIKNLITVEE